MVPLWRARWAMSVDDDAYDPDSLGQESGSYVPAFFARDQEEAEEYCELLSDHDIPARCESDGDSLADADEDDEDEQRAAGRRGMTHGVPVLVPENLLDEASEVIADREDFADFDDDEDDEDDEDDYDLEELTEEDEHEALIDDEDEDALFDQADDLEDIEEEEGEELF
jgi:hypothetical protein